MPPPGPLDVDRSEQPQAEGWPVGVVVLALINLLAGGTLLAGALAHLLGVTTLAPALNGRVEVWRVGVLAGWFVPVHIVMGFGLLLLVTAAALVKGAAWSWHVAIVLQALVGFIGILKIVGGDPFAAVDILVAGFFLWYLLQPVPRTFFRRVAAPVLWRRRRPAHPPPE